ALFPHRSVLDNAAYGLAVQGVPRAERARMVLIRAAVPRRAAPAAPARDARCQRRPDAVSAVR
ncbi:hypothetical protein, partial [Streptomyces longwoodensis]